MTDSRSDTAPNTKRVASTASGSSAVGKAFGVLSALRESNHPMTLSALAEQIGLAPSSAHSILGHLVRQAVVLQLPDKRYQLGPQTLYLGAGYARSAPVYRACWMELVNAAGNLSVTAAVAVPWDDRFIVLNAHRASKSPVAVPFGGRVPLDAGSWGKVYYAWAAPELPKQLTRFTDATIVDHTKYSEAIEEARRIGYATDNGEYRDGFGAVCAPVTSAGGFEGLASFIAPLSELSPERFELIGQTLAAITARGSMALGDGKRIDSFGTA